MTIYDIIILGGGPGGYTAALYAARAGLSTLVIEKMAAGGQMCLTTQIDNYPGFDQGIDGFTLGQRMMASAQRFGAETLMARATALSLTPPVKSVTTDHGIFHSRALIIATGADHRHLNLPGETAFAGRGVAYCAACDGMLYKNKTVAVIGGGNSAAADALLLSRICKKVILVHRRDQLRATRVYHQPLSTAANVDLYLNCELQEILGNQRVNAIRIQNNRTGAESILEVDGVFVSIGRAPATDLVNGQLSLDDGGYILADETTRTTIDGVYAVGDVRSKPLRQIATAIADGATAVHFAEQYLSNCTDAFA